MFRCYNSLMPIDTRLTYEDYCLLPSDGKRYEIIEGELLVTPAPLTRHQKVVLNLGSALLNFTKKHGLGEVYCAPVDVVLSTYDVVEPDLLYVSKDRLGIVTEKNLQGAPDLAVEVLSESTARVDRTIKLKLYARFGVREYWLIDPIELWAEIYRLGSGTFELAPHLEAPGVLTSPLFPGFSLPLRKLVE